MGNKYFFILFIHFFKQQENKIIIFIFHCTVPLMLLKEASFSICKILFIYCFAFAVKYDQGIFTCVFSFKTRFRRL